MSELTCQTETLGARIVVVRTTGYIDDDGGEKIRKVVESFVEKGETRFLFNLGGSPIVNSTGIACILELIEQVVYERNGQIHFCNLAPAVLTVFKMMGVEGSCKIHDTEANGLAQFGS